MQPLGLARTCGVTGIPGPFDPKKSRATRNGRTLEGVICERELRASGLRSQTLELLQVKAAAQPLNAALGVHDPLLAGVERMAFAADFDPEGRFGTPGIEHVATGAGYHGLKELGMDVGFHNDRLPIHLDLLSLEKAPRTNPETCPQVATGVDTWNG